jgi:quinol monooxygenase YgiN
MYSHHRVKPTRHFALIKRVTFIAKDGCEDKLKELLEAMIKPSKAEVGCLNYNIYQYKNNKAKFMAIETWADEKALDGHKTSKHYKIYKSSYEQYTKDKYTDELDYLVTIN